MLGYFPAQNSVGKARVFLEAWTDRLRTRTEVAGRFWVRGRPITDQMTSRTLARRLERLGHRPEALRR